MISILDTTAARLWPDFDTLADSDRARLRIELVGVVYSLPLAVVCIGWLLAETDFNVVRSQWPMLMLFLVLAFLFTRLSFFQMSGTEAGSYSYDSSSMASIVIVSAAFLYGQTGVWILVLGLFTYVIDELSPHWSRFERWNIARNLLFGIWSGITSFLLGLMVYEWLGGYYPFSELTLASSWIAFLAVFIIICLNVLFFLSLIAVWRLTGVRDAQSKNQDQDRSLRLTVRFFLLADIPAFFGVLAAATHSVMGLGAFLFLVGGALLASLLARRFSSAAVLNQQRSREVVQLEQLGRAIIAAPADASTLPELLADFLPRMFEYRQAEIRLFPDRSLLKLPEDQASLPDPLWQWYQVHPRYFKLDPGEENPWDMRRLTDTVIYAPILDTQTAKTLGGICLILESIRFLNLPVDYESALQVLAAQISSAIHGADVFTQALAHEKMVQELAVASQIQTRFLPKALPQAAGWQLSATLKPARETSGDFYDVFELPDGHLVLIMADVADKGVGPALFMAMSRTLLRTHASNYPAQPHLALAEVNQRILADTHTDLFVTVFLGVLDPIDGHMIYANAGHNPPYRLTPSSLDDPLAMPTTGLPLGILEDATWEMKAIDLAPGDILLLYTDGVTEAHNPSLDLFGEQRLLAAVNSTTNGSTQHMQDSILAAIDHFVGEEPNVQHDDLTLMVLKREPL